MQAAQIPLIALFFIAPPALLAAVCAYGPVENRFLVWRKARHEAVWSDAALDYLNDMARPIRIAQWTGCGWAEVVPVERCARPGRHRTGRMVALTVKAA